MASTAPSTRSPHFEDVVRSRMSRRGALKAMVVLGGGAAGAMAASGKVSAYEGGELTFDAIALNQADQVSTAAGFTHDVLISWGDPVVPGAPAFDIENQTPATQARQFGFNNDYISFLPYRAGTDRFGGLVDGSPNEGLLFVNHEYTSANMMFPGVTYDGFDSADATTDEQKRIEIEAHGSSVIEVSLDSATNSWGYNPRSGKNRRITGTTPMRLSGPALGHRFLKSNADRSGRRVIGMFNQCGGGVTPWGTVLTTEENFDQYFGNFDEIELDRTFPDYDLRIEDEAEFTYSGGRSSRGWEDVDARFDMELEPNEVFRHGYIIEIDPFRPNRPPIKRTALGRFKHEAAAGIVAANGRYVVYSGDDAGQEYIYKFVTSRTVNTNNRIANDTLLDSGVLYAARYDDDGTGEWLPLVFGEGPLTAENGWEDQAHVLLFARSAANALGATPMDRPEDVDINPLNGKVYAAMTGIGRDAPDAANPRISDVGTEGTPDTDPEDNGSAQGHIIEMTEDGGDQTSATFTWEMFMICGTPNVGGSLDAVTQPAEANSSGRTYYAGFDESQVSPVARPDNVSFDSLGNLWISTDGMPGSAPTGNNNDTVFGVPTEGSERGHCKALVTGPLGAEMTGPYFTNDDTSLFVAVQHPGEDGSIASPQSTWNSVTTSGGGVCSRNGVIVVRRENASSIPAGVNDPDPEIPEFPVPVAAAAATAGIGGLLAFRQSRMKRTPGVTIG